jgi:hypothetical protein
MAHMMRCHQAGARAREAEREARAGALRRALREEQAEARRLRARVAGQAEVVKYLEWRLDQARRLLGAGPPPALIAAASVGAARRLAAAFSDAARAPGASETGALADSASPSPGSSPRAPSAGGGAGCGSGGGGGSDDSDKENQRGNAAPERASAAADVPAPAPERALKEVALAAAPAASASEAVTVEPLRAPVAEALLTPPQTGAPADAGDAANEAEAPPTGLRSSARARRRVSYALPSLAAKLRQGDPGSFGSTGAAARRPSAFKKRAPGARSTPRAAPGGAPRSAAARSTARRDPPTPVAE